MLAWEEYLPKPIRQYVETVFSRLTSFFPRKIHTVTPRSFELKTVWFLLAFSIQCKPERGSSRVFCPSSTLVLRTAHEADSVNRAAFKD
jgi:hypothetical protein